MIGNLLMRFTPLQQIFGAAGLIALIAIGGWIWSLKATADRLETANAQLVLAHARTRVVGEQIARALDKCTRVNLEMTHDVELATAQAAAARAALERRESEIRNVLKGIADQERTMRDRLAQSQCVRYDEPLDPAFISWLRNDTEGLPNPD